MTQVFYELNAFTFQKRLIIYSTFITYMLYFKNMINKINVHISFKYMLNLKTFHIYLRYGKTIHFFNKHWNDCTKSNQ